MTAAAARWGPHACATLGSRAEDVAIEAQPVAVGDLVALRLAEAGAPQTVADLRKVADIAEPIGRRYFARPGGRPRAVVDAARPAALAHPVAVAVGEAMAAVG